MSGLNQAVFLLVVLFSLLAKESDASCFRRVHVDEQGFGGKKEIMSCSGSFRKPMLYFMFDESCCKRHHPWTVYLGDSGSGQRRASGPSWIAEGVVLGSGGSNVKAYFDCDAGANWCKGNVIVSIVECANLCTPGFKLASICNTFADSRCSQCEIGTYQDSSGATSCKATPVGHYASRIGQSFASKCSVGTYQDKTGQKLCKDAPPGHYVSLEGQSRYEACAAGSYQSASGKSFCSKCPRGRYQSERGKTICEIAARGHYVPDIGSAKALQCTFGTYQDETGQSFCKAAPVGHYADTLARTRATPCPPGEYQDTTHASFCKVCPEGKYQDRFAQSSCIDAPAGHYAPSKRQSHPLPCRKGSYQDRMGSSICFPCAHGFFQDLEGQAFCKPTPRGHFTLFEDQTTATECPPGSYQNSTQQQFCHTCPLGTFQGQKGQVLCMPCALNSTNSEAGSSECSRVVGSTEEDIALVYNSSTGRCRADVTTQELHALVVGYLPTVLGRQDVDIPRMLLECTASLVNSFRTSKTEHGIVFLQEQLGDIVAKLGALAETTEDAEIVGALLQSSASLKLLPRDRKCGAIGEISISIPRGAFDLCEVAAVTESGKPVKLLGVTVLGQEVVDAKPIIDGSSSTCVGIVDANNTNTWIRLQYSREDPISSISIVNSKKDAWSKAAVYLDRFVVASQLGPGDGRNKETHKITIPDIAFPRCDGEVKKSFSAFMPPPVQLVKSSVKAIEAGAYKTSFTPEELFSKCFGFAASLSYCPFGTMLVPKEPKECQPFKNEEVMTNIVLLAYCSVIDEFVGSDLSLDLLVASRNAVYSMNMTEPSKHGVLRAAKSIRDIARAAAEAGIRTIQGRVNVYEHLAQSMAPLIDSLSRQISGLDFDYITSKARIRTVCRVETEACEGNPNVISDALNIASVKKLLVESHIKLTNLVFASWGSLHSIVQDSYMKTREQLNHLGELVINSDATVYEKSMKALTEIIKLEQANVRTRMTLAKQKANDGRDKFSAIVTRIKNEAQGFDANMLRVGKLSSALENTTFEFYECRKKEELAQIARKQVTAIFDIVKGSILVIKDAVEFVVSGGASAAYKTALKMGKNAKKMKSKAKKKLSKMFPSNRKGRSGKKKKAEEGNEKDKNVNAWKYIEENYDVLNDMTSEQVDAIEDCIRNGISFFSNPKLQDVAGYLQFFQSNLEILGEQGVPFTEGAAEILGGVSVLVESAKEKQAVQAEYEVDFADATDTFAQVASMLEKLGDVFAKLICEINKVMESKSPPDGPSVAESTSKAIWQGLLSVIVQFIRESEMHNDFVRVTTNPTLRQQLRSDFNSRVSGQAPLVLNEKTSNVEDGLALRAAKAGDSVSFRRALNEKEGCDRVVDLAFQGQDDIDKIERELRSTVFGAEAAHESMIELVQVARDFRLASLELELLQEQDRDISKTIEEFGNSDTKDFDNLYSKYRTAVDQLKIETSNIQVVTSNSTSSELITLALTNEDGSVWNACMQSWYRTMSLPEICRMDNAQLFASREEISGASTYIDEVRKSIVNRVLRRIPEPRSNWLRIPVASAAQVSNTKNGVINGKTKLTVDLARLAARCGAIGAEVLTMVIVVEDLANNGEPLLIESWEGQTPDLVEQGIEPSNPFYKLDKNNELHQFEIEHAPRKFSELAIVKDSCQQVSNGGQLYAVDLPSKKQLCIKDKIFHPTPLLGTYVFELGKIGEKLAEYTFTPFLEFSVYVLVESENTPTECEIPEKIGFQDSALQPKVNWLPTPFR